MADKEQIGFPTTPDADGFYYVSEMEKDAGILTKDYETGSQTKKLTLENKQIAIVRKLRGRDFVTTKKQIQVDNTQDFENVNMAIAITIDGKQQPPEFYLDDIFQTDYSRMAIAYGALNF